MGMSLKDALDIQKMPERQKSLARKGRKVYLGHETRPGWSGSLPFYLFQCPDCERLGKDYPHSWPESQYLSCPECGARIDFVRFWTGIKMFFSLFLLLSFLLRIKFTKHDYKKGRVKLGFSIFQSPWLTSEVNKFLDYFFNNLF